MDWIIKCKIKRGAGGSHFQVCPGLWNCRCRCQCSSFKIISNQAASLPALIPRFWIARWVWLQHMVCPGRLPRTSLRNCRLGFHWILRHIPSLFNLWQPGLSTLPSIIQAHFDTLFNWFLIPITCDLIPNTWYLIPNTWYLISAGWSAGVKMKTRIAGRRRLPAFGGGGQHLFEKFRPTGRPVDIRHQLPGIRYQVSGIKYHVLGIRC